jgi:putative serine protease PepD
MTDTNHGPAGESRNGDLANGAPAPENSTAPAGQAAQAGEPTQADPPTRATQADEPTQATQATQATGTVYQPGQAPQPYAAPAPAAAASAQHTAPTQALNGDVPPAFGGPRPGETQPTTPLGGVPPHGPDGGQPPHRSEESSEAAPKQRRVGFGVAAAVVAAALIGGASGAGVTALVTSNDSPASTESTGTSQNVVVNDTDSVNQITAVAAKASPSVVTISVAGGQGAGTGSGIILSEDGYVLTNTHVVTLDGATGDGVIQVKTNDGRLYDAELVGTDPLSDLAVIKLVDAADLTPLEFADSDELNVGDTAIAIGAPLGLAGTVTNGIVSALNRSIDVASSAAPSTPDDSEGEGDGSDDSPFDFFFDLPNPDGSQPQQQAASGQVSLPVIQTDAAINPGNSGGALLDSEGRLIGVNVAILSAGGAATEAGNIGVGFAVPSNLAERVAREIIENGAATHGLLGATVTSAEADGNSDTVGALISEVTPGGAAEEAGLAAGDVVTEFNGVPITDQTDLTAQVRALPGGGEAEVTFTRDGESQTVQVTVDTFEG